MNSSLQIPVDAVIAYVLCTDDNHASGLERTNEEGEQLTTRA